MSNQKAWRKEVLSALSSEHSQRACSLVRSACCVIAFHRVPDSLSLRDFLLADP